MEHTSDIKDLLLQVDKPIFALDHNRSVEFCSEQIDYFSQSSGTPSIMAFAPALPLENLGDPVFKNRHRIRYNYVAGAMANGITSAEMVKTMAQNGMLAFLGAGGLSIDRIEENILALKKDLGDLPYGFNLIHSLADPDHEMATVELYHTHGVRLVSAAAFLRMTLPLVYYRVKGIHRDGNGKVVTPNQVKAKASRIEIARQFFSPPPEKLINQLLEMGKITDEEAHLSQHIPMAYDLTAEADSGGHTDNRPALALLPTMIALKNEFMEKYDYPEPLCVGLAGGVATPQSAAAAFSMGAAYILTGSINQSCVEAGICDDVKQMLAQAEQADVAMAPAADMFEIGAKVQVLKRGTMFPVRAEKLYKYYVNHNAFEELDERARKEIEDKFLMASFDQAWESTKAFFVNNGNLKEVEKGEASPKHRMALVFRSYLGLSSKWAIQGIPERKMDYQIWCGPAIGAFNQWVKGSFLETAKNRKTAEVALNLLLGASVAIRASILMTQGIKLPSGSDLMTPMPEAVLSGFI